MNRNVLASDKTVDDRKGCVALRHKGEPAKKADSPVGRLLHLQRTIGNREVQRLLDSRVIQAKLTVSRPDDIHEQEADRVADQVLRMPDPMLQRQKPEEEEEKLQTSPLAGSVTPLINRQPGEEEEPLQAKAESDGSPTVDATLERSISNLRGGGQPLSGASRDYFEPRFGCDFSQVRVHTDAGAAGLAQSVNAKAFTLGQDVVFGAGQYAPDNDEGKKLLAHELTHVVQQGEVPS